jgi:hypothetical protein
VVMSCTANYLMPGNPGGSGDVLIKDMQTGSVTRMNQTQTGAVSPKGGWFQAVLLAVLP